MRCQSSKKSKKDKKKREEKSQEKSKAEPKTSKGSLETSASAELSASRASLQETPGPSGVLASSSLSAFDSSFDKGTPVADDLASSVLELTLQERPGSSRVLASTSFSASELPLRKRPGSSRVLASTSFSVSELPLRKRPGSSSVPASTSFLASRQSLQERPGSSRDRAGTVAGPSLPASDRTPITQRVVVQVHTTEEGAGSSKGSRPKGSRPKRARPKPTFVPPIVICSASPTEEESNEPQSYIVHQSRTRLEEALRLSNTASVVAAPIAEVRAPEDRPMGSSIIEEPLPDPRFLSPEMGLGPREEMIEIPYEEALAVYDRIFACERTLARLIVTIFPSLAPREREIGRGLTVYIVVVVAELSALFTVAIIVLLLALLEWAFPN